MSLTVDELKEKLKDWANTERTIANLQELSKKIKEEVEAEVTKRGQELYLEDDTAHVIMTSKGTYDWESVALLFEPDDDEIKKWTETRWNKLAEDLCPDKKKLEQIKKVYYTPGIPFAQCRLK